MTPSEFAAKWQASQRNEQAASKEHFIVLCRMLGWPTPNGWSHQVGPAVNEKPTACARRITSTGRTHVP